MRWQELRQLSGAARSCSHSHGDIATVPQLHFSSLRNCSIHLNANVCLQVAFTRTRVYTFIVVPPPIQVVRVTERAIWRKTRPYLTVVHHVTEYRALLQVGSEAFFCERPQLALVRRRRVYHSQCRWPAAASRSGPGSTYARTCELMRDLTPR